MYIRERERQIYAPLQKNTRYYGFLSMSSGLHKQRTNRERASLGIAFFSALHGTGHFTWHHKALQHTCGSVVFLLFAFGSPGKAAAPPATRWISTRACLPRQLGIQIQPGKTNTTFTNITQITKYELWKL